MPRNIFAAVLVVVVTWHGCGAQETPPHYDLLRAIPEATDNSFVWRTGNGAYRFGLKAADQWRVETRNEDGAVKGQYYYRTPDGGEVNMSYNSGGGQQQDQRLRQSGALPHDQDELIPYGALRAATDKVVRLRAGDTNTREDFDLQAIITEVRHDIPL